MVFSSGFSQNLVMNPSFESTGTLKCSWYVTQAEFNAAVTNWTCPTGGSTDIFHTSLATSCFCSPFSTDPSRVGQQAPRTGNAMTAIFVYGNGGCSPYREYLQGRLSAPLVAGQTYDIEMYVSLADESNRGCNNIGFKFSTAPVNVSSMCVYNTTPDVNYTGPIITDKSNWTKISFCYTPSTSGLQYFMIGNFYNDAATSTAGAGAGSENTVRYFVDDVKVELSTSSSSSAGTNATVNLCPGDGPLNLFDVLGGSPTTGGSWSGPSILTGGSLGTFFPTTSAIGTYTYSLSSSACAGGGGSSAQVTVTLNGSSNATINQPATVCTTSPSVQLTAATPGGTWTSSCGACVSSSGLFNPSVAGAGSHTVTYNIGGPCPGSDTKTIVVQAPPTVSAGSPVAICAGNSTALTASGAASYTWSPSASLSSGTGNSVTASPAATTIYTVVGTTGVCSSQANVTVTVNPLPVLQASPNTAICINDTAILSVSGANSYTWSPGTGLSTISGASVNAYPQATTTYTVTGTDGNNCSNQTSVTVSINPLPNVNAGNDIAICANETVTLTATGADTYEWSPNINLSATTGSSVDASPQNTTTYTVKGTDANGCENTDNMVVTVNPVPVVTVSLDIAICLNDATTLTATGANTYTWTPAGSLSSGTGASVTATPATTTTYIVTGTSLNCSAQASVTVTVNMLPPVTVTPDLSICLNDTTTLTASGATSYSWSPGAGLSTVTGASVQAYPQATITYTITGTDDNNCSNQATVTVTVNPLPVVDAGVDVAICLDETTTLSASGANTYEWTPNTNLSSNIGQSVDASPQNTTTYTVKGTDINGCENTDAVEVTVNPLPVITASPDVSICENASTTLTVSGADNYVWFPAAGLSNTVGTQVTATPAVTTTYTVTGTDNNGCVSSDQVRVSLFNPPLVDLGPDVAICQGNSIQLSATGAVSYVWTPLTGIVSSNPSNSIVNSSPTGTITYDVVGTDANGCTGQDQITVTVRDNPSPSFSVFPAVGCAPFNTNFTYTGSPVVQYEWNFGNGLQSALPAPSTIYPQPGTYTVSVHVVDQFGCEATYAQADVISVHAFPVAGFSANPQQMWLDDAWVTVVDGSANAISWSYLVSDGFVSQNPSFTHQFVDTGHYVICQVVTSNVGCSDTACADVYVNPTSTIYIPNAFTPGNSDNLNGTFRVYGNGLEHLELLIFDRWGELIFRSNDQNVGWDGTFGGKLCKQDVYVYKVNYVNHRKEQKSILGSVTLVR